MKNKQSELTRNDFGKSYDWKKKELLYQKEKVAFEIRRIPNFDFREYEIKIENQKCGYISQGEDKTFTPYCETYDQSGRLQVSLELEDSIVLNTAIIRIIRKRKGHEKIDYRQQYLDKHKQIS